MRLEVKIARTEISFHHEKNPVYVSFQCDRNEINFFFVLTFSSAILVFMKCSDVHMFLSEWFHFRVVFT